MLYPSAPGTAVLENANAMIDYSNISEGYVIAAYTGDPDKKCKIQIANGGQLQHFAVPSDGTTKVFPLCFGDGHYSIIMYRQVADVRYSKIAVLSLVVKLRNSLVPWLYPNTYAEYGPNSECAKIAAAICKRSNTDADRISAIFLWIIDNVEYDKELAQRVQTEKWWLPDPDEVISTGKSICFGYASLMAAMCRSQGIPTKVTVGTIKSGALHAWNEVYFREAWTRIDVTLMDGMGDSAVAYVQDDTNYSAQYCG